MYKYFNITLHGRHGTAGVHFMIIINQYQVIKANFKTHKFIIAYNFHIETLCTHYEKVTN